MFLLKTKKLLCLLLLGCFFHSFLFAQNITVSGTITTDAGAPLEGASVVIYNSTRGTTTNSKGTFTLSAAATDSLLVYYVGYDTAVVAVQPALSIRLHVRGNELNDVIVIGYGTARKKELTGAITTVTSKDFQQGTITTPEQLIAGKVAGVSITSNGGSPGAGSVIRVRGGASLAGSSDPLIVIDGLPVAPSNIYGASNPLSLVNPNDIASFTVLKDAASTAIYGSRASNGVILITTKKGVSGKPRINFSSVVSASTLQKEADVLSADEFRKYIDSFGKNTTLVGQPASSYLGSANTDWQKEIYQTAITTDNNLSVSGAFKNLPYRISAGYLNQDGLLQTDNLQRVSAGISLSPSLFDKHLKIDVNLKGAATHTRFANGAAISSAVYFDPTQPVHDAASPFGGYFERYTTDGSTITLNKLAPRNPVALLDLYNNSSNVQRSYGNVQFDYSFHFLPELHANLNLGYDVAKGDGNVKVPAYAAQNYLDTGQNNQYSNKVANTVGEFYLNYNKTIASIKSNITATAGYGYYNNLSTNYNYAFIRANGNIAPGSEPKYTFDKPENTLISYYGRLIYTYNTKYILAASFRTDGSSRFSEANRWGQFPSLAFTWRINDENFLKNSKTLSNLNLRLSYGVTGNQEIPNYLYISSYAFSDNASQVQFGNTYYNVATPSAYDATIKWEQTEAYNAGIDYGFLNNRLTGSIDVYSRKTKDLLNTIPIPSGSNFSSTITTNVGNVSNQGIEFLISASPIQKKHFSWDISFNAAYNNSKITNLTATKDSSYPGAIYGNGVQINSVGNTPYAFYVYHQEYDKSGKPVEGVYADINGDGIINTQDLYKYKSGLPKYIFGFTTQFTMDRWTLSTVLRANTGNYMYNALATGATSSNVLNSLGYLANTLSELTKSNFYYGQQSSDYFVQNASFLKMDNVTLGYNAGFLFHNKVGLRVNASCQNVFTVTKYSGIDPEIFGGYDAALYPRPRIYTLGVNLQF